MILCIVGASPHALEAPRLVEELVRAGREVRIILDEKARLFVGPSAFRAPVHESWRSLDPLETVIYFPVTTATISRLANGLGVPSVETEIPDDIPVYVMSDYGDGMQDHTVVRENLARLETDGIHVLESAEEIAAAVIRNKVGPMSGMRVVVTAGGTHERIDSVRFIGNRSSGKMGLAVAREALALGAEVEVVAANIEDREPGVEWSPVESVDEMRDAVMRAVKDADALVMAAAVSDFRPESVAGEKIRRGGNERLTLELVATTDVLAEVRGAFPDLFIVGFAATHGDPVPDARDKLERKGADLVVGNDISQAGIGFSTDENEVYIVGRESERFVSRRAKNEVARAILEVLISEFGQVTGED